MHINILLLDIIIEDPLIAILGLPLSLGGKSDAIHFTMQGWKQVGAYIEECTKQANLFPSNR